MVTYTVITVCCRLIYCRIKRSRRETREEETDKAIENTKMITSTTSCNTIEDGIDEDRCRPHEEVRLGYTATSGSVDYTYN